jgi:Domain of unknown function (DUF5606)
MELKEIAAISGKPGLFKILKPSRSGVIVETLDNQKKKLAIPSAGKVSVLKEISIYTTEKDGSVPLAMVLQLIKEKYDAELPISGKAETAELMNFLSGIVPNYDSTKVYPSDVKKLVLWYSILYKEAPETLLPQPEEVIEEVEVQDEELIQGRLSISPKIRVSVTEQVQAEEVKTEETVTEVKTEKIKAEPKTKATPAKKTAVAKEEESVKEEKLAKKIPAKKVAAEAKTEVKEAKKVKEPAKEKVAKATVAKKEVVKKETTPKTKKETVAKTKEETPKEEKPKKTPAKKK